ncbi:MAG: HAD family hydrolase, partial [Steroidobacteraceae bacterium]
MRVPNCAVPGNQVRLVLWDVDHTLVATRGIGREVYESVFPRIAGVPLRELAVVHGRTELDIIDETLRLHHVPADESTVRRIADELAREYRRRFDELSARAQVLPGVRDALSWVDTRDDLIQSTVTGNPHAVARLKLEATGLAGHLRWSCGAFGDDDRDRARLVRLARTRATDSGADITNVVVVGDTPSDVMAATSAGATAVGVATG